MLYLHRDSDSDVIKAVSVTEFLLAHPCLCFVVFDSKVSSVSSTEDSTGHPVSVDGYNSHG